MRHATRHDRRRAAVKRAKDVYAYAVARAMLFYADFIDATPSVVVFFMLPYDVATALRRDAEAHVLRAAMIITMMMMLMLLSSRRLRRRCAVDVVAAAMMMRAMFTRCR